MPREDRKRPCPCGSGRPWFHCCRARDLARGEASARARDGQRLVDAAIEALLPVVQAQHVVACGAGCNACCASYVRATPAEAELIAGWLVDGERAPIREAFLARLADWRATVGPELAELDALTATHRGSPPPGSEEAEAYAAATRLHQRRRANCPFNDDAGLCTIYEVRPLPCRATLVVETSAHCLPDAAQGPTLVRPRQLQDAIRDARARIARAPRIPDAPDAERALPEAVAAALARRSAT